MISIGISDKSRPSGKFSNLKLYSCWADINLNLNPLFVKIPFSITFPSLSTKNSFTFLPYVDMISLNLKLLKLLRYVNVLLFSKSP